MSNSVPPYSRPNLAAVAAVGLTTAMGVHTLRAFLAMIVWNIGVDRSQIALGAVALSVYAVGLVGWFVTPRLRGAGAPNLIVVLFAGAYAWSHFVRDPLLTPILALASAVGWLWFLPTLMARLGQVDAVEALAPGILLGFATAIALQTVLHGLDMAMLRGLLPGLGATALAAVLWLFWRQLAAQPATSPDPVLHLPGWGLAAFGPFLVLQLTLLANTGQAQMLTALPDGIASFPLLLGLAAGAAVIALPAFPPLRFVGAAAAVILLQPSWLSGGAVWLLPVIQTALAVVLSAALRPPVARRPTAAFLAGAAGLLVAFVLIFLYYSRYEWPTLWSVMAALTAVPALFRRAPAGAARSFTAVLAIIVVGVVGAAISRMPPRPDAQSGTAPSDLRILDYNIHMAFDAAGVPDPQGIARVIAAADPDVVGLQEVGRGWTVNGGADLVAWLRWRFPRYRLTYGPMNGALWGNVILSRYPVTASGSLRFPIRQSRFQRGLTWVTIPTARGELLAITTHFAHEEDGDPDRLAQSGDLLAFWRARERTVVVGDLNAGMESAPLIRLQAAGLQDVLALHGLGGALTFPSPNPSERLDYILISGDLRSVAAELPRTTASDHLPLVARIRVP